MSTEFWGYDGATWRKAKQVWGYDGATWRKAKQIWAYDGAAWRKVFAGVCSSGYSGLTSAGISVVGGLCGTGSCISQASITATWVPDSACSGEHIAVALSKNGGSYSTKCDDAAACDDCADSPYSWTYTGVGTLTTSSAACSGQCDATGCFGPENYKWRVQRHDDVGHTLCEEVYSSTSSNYYGCACADCDGVT